MYFSEQELSQVLFNAEFIYGVATLGFKEAAAAASGRGFDRSRSLRVRSPSSRRVAGCRVPPRRGPWGVLRPASRLASRPVPVRATLLRRSFYFFLLLHLAASSVRRSGFDCCRCSLIVLHITSSHCSHFSWFSFLLSCSR